MSTANRNLLSSTLLSERVTAAGALVASETQRDLVRLWDVQLPLSVPSHGEPAQVEERVEIHTTPPHKTKEGALAAVFSAVKGVFSCSSSFPATHTHTGESCIAVPSRDHLQAYLAVLHEEQLVVVRNTQQGPASAQSVEILVFTASRLHGSPRGVSWTNDDSPALFVATDRGLKILTLPEPCAPLEHANTVIRTLRAVSETAIAMSAAPRGRLVLLSSGADMTLVDAWLDQSSTLLGGNYQVENFAWSADGDKAFVHYRNGQIVVFETYNWKSRVYNVKDGSDDDSLSFNVNRRVEFLWTHERQTLFLVAPDSLRSVFRVNLDLETPNARTLNCAAIDKPNDGMRAAEDKRIHAVAVSANGRFLAISYCEKSENKVDSVVEIFECEDVETMSFRHFSTVQRYGLNNDVFPESFAFSNFEDRGERQPSKQRAVFESDIYVDKIDSESRALSLFPAVEVRRRGRAFNLADRYLLWVHWSDCVLAPYVVG